MASAEGEAFLQDGAGAGARSGERRAGGREAGWQERYFSAWRGLFMYKQSRDFAVCLEISFRGAVWLVLFGSPIIWGLNKDPESPFYESTFWGKILEKNGIVSFVYTLAPTVGQTISNAVGGVAGTLTAAAFSLLMYLVYPDGCSGAERFELCYFFGWLAGAASIVCCQLLDVGMSFRIFYISNFVYFWMAFLNPDAKLRTAPDSPTEWFMGLEFVDWGGEAYDGVVAMISGACLALIVTLLPYPMNSMERARDSAFAAVSMLEQTWAKLADFYLANDKDERRQAMMICSMKAFKNHVCSLKEHLEASWWESWFLGLCGRSWRSQHLFLTELEATTSRCIERLTHVVDACMREQFEDIHDEMVKPDMCGDAVRALATSASGLLGRALVLADDGKIQAADRDELLRAADGVRADEVHLTKKMWQSIVTINEQEVKRAGQSNQTRDSVVEAVAQQLTDEQIFIFSICDFGSSVQAYSRWLAEQHDAPLPPRHSFDLIAGLKSVFKKDTIMADANLNCALRGTLSIFIGFAIGYWGYSEMIPAKDATIPGTIAVLLSRSLTSPINKSLGRLQGVVLGKFSGQLVFALLGWCYAWAQISLSAIVLSYVWLTLFIYHYTSSFSYLGCLAAAFGTQAFLAGCSGDVVHPDAVIIVNMLIAIWIMTVIDLAFRMGRPSELAFGAYLEAWAAWEHVLERLLTVEDTRVDPVQITTLINRAETLADEAAHEPRLWRAPFPGALFSEMLALARTMRKEVICIHTVLCEHNRDSDDTFSKKEWFKRLLADEGSGWSAYMSEILKEVDATHDMVEKVEAQNGKKVPTSIQHVRRLYNTKMESGNLKLYKSGLATSKIQEMAAETSSLVEDEFAQTNFVYGCLQSIKEVNFRMQLEIIKHGV